MFHFKVLFFEFKFDLETEEPSRWKRTRPSTIERRLVQIDRRVGHRRPAQHRRRSEVLRLQRRSVQDRFRQGPVDLRQRAHEALDDGQDLREERPLLAVVADAAEHQSTKRSRCVGPDALHVGHDLAGADKPENLEKDSTSSNQAKSKLLGSGHPTLNVIATRHRCI